MDSEDFALLEPIDCELSKWSNWTECSVTCGRGIMERSRAVARSQQGLGKPCEQQSLREIQGCNHVDENGDQIECPPPVLSEEEQRMADKQ